MRSTLQRAAVHPALQLEVVATGMHLSSAHGHTVDEIRSAGLTVAAEIPVDVTTRTQASMSASIGECLQGMTRVLTQRRPDVLLLLGDRGEMLAGAIAALHIGVVTVHIHGGERSGTVDEPVRHAISKLSTYHLVATPESRERLERMGEKPAHILVTGAPGLDGLAELGLATFPQGFISPSGQPFVLALFHPVVQQVSETYAQTSALCQALHAIGLPVIWLEPNADAGSLEVLRALDDFPLPAGSRRIQHLPRSQFCSAMRQCVVMVGNSSSGIIEAATFGTPVVNLGVRQCLRERNANVLDVAVEAGAIRTAMQTAIAHGPWPCDNVYGDGHAGERVVQFLTCASIDPSLILKANAY
jgi:GDP/UDP-N,N'-diacetylbacillosamine 2-epimerase (hydrolysing)